MKKDRNQHNKRNPSIFEESTSLFASISLTPNNWIWEVDSNGVYTYCSSGVYDIFGYLPEEIIGKKLFYFLTPEDGIILGVIFQNAIINKTAISNLEISTQNKNGKDLFFVVNGTPFFDLAGDLIGYRGINHDITILKEKEAKLSVKRLMLKTLLESIPDLVWLKDANGVYLACNPKFERLFGASEAEIVGKTDCDFVSKELADSFLMKDKEAIAANKSSVYQEWVTYFDDGHSEFIETIKTPMYDLDGNLTAILGIARDITKHKQTLDALKESQSRLTIAMNIAKLGIYEYDINTNKFSLDERFFSIFGKTLEEKEPIESIEYILRIFIHPDDVERVNNEIKNALASPDSESTFQLEYRFIHPNGQVRNGLTCFVVSKDDNGKPIKIYGVIQDITIVKKAELKLTELNASKDKFFSIIAHDLKGPFNSIIGFSEILNDKIRAGDLSTMENYARMINDSAVQTLRLLENLLEWANLQTGKIGFNPTLVNLSIIFSEEFGVLNDMAAGKNIKLSSFFPENMTIIADRNMIKTILRNLIFNAIKFTHQDGKVDVIARIGQEKVEFSVSDNGIGMTEENLAKLFRIDANLSTRGTQNEKGTGLGLILCKEFVEKHGGKIWAESEPGKGSHFKFIIPLNIEILSHKEGHL